MPGQLHPCQFAAAQSAAAGGVAAGQIMIAAALAGCQGRSWCKAMPLGQLTLAAPEQFEVEIRFLG
jgi:hypothetical protein